MPSHRSVAGLQIEKIASGLKHPRQLLVLPNGDVLVVEANGPGRGSGHDAETGHRREGQGQFRQGRQGREPRHPAAPEARRRGEWEQHVYIENLHSPFGIQLVGDTLYVANTGNIMKYHYTPGETKMSDPGVELGDLPSTVNHHWTKALLASPDGKHLYVGSGSNSNITENGLEVEYRRAAVLEVDAATGASRVFASGIRNPTGLGWEPQSGKLWAIANERDEIGADLVPGLPDLGAGKRLLWLALQLLRPARRPPRPAAAPGPGRESHQAGLRPRGARGGAGPAVLHRDRPAAVQGRRLRRRARQLGPHAAERLPGRVRALCKRHAQRALPSLS
jgi:hypothetical protein